jgi:hypothetical protein
MSDGEDAAASHDPFIPLADRPISELRSRADELRRMAATARIAGARNALLKLADRFSALADRRAASGMVKGRSRATDDWRD